MAIFDEGYQANQKQEREKRGILTTSTSTFTFRTVNQGVIMLWRSESVASLPHRWTCSIQNGYAYAEPEALLIRNDVGYGVP
jgi:hypothetical protein